MQNKEFSELSKLVGHVGPLKALPSILVCKARLYMQTQKETPKQASSALPPIAWCLTFGTRSLEKEMVQTRTPDPALNVDVVFHVKRVGYSAGLQTCDVQNNSSNGSMLIGIWCRLQLNILINV